MDIYKFREPWRQGVGMNKGIPCMWMRGARQGRILRPRICPPIQARDALLLRLMGSPIRVRLMGWGW